jgi:putative endonuclease
MENKNIGKDSRKKTGAWGEEKAARYLENQGVKILKHNIYTPYGEIDLLGEDDGQLVFVEVKTLKSNKFGNPEISINSRKQSHMINSAMHYLQENDLLQRSWRIDVIALQAIPSTLLKFKWFKNAVNQ